MVIGAVLVAGGFFIGAGKNHPVSLVPLQRQVTALQQKVLTDQYELSAAATQISTLDGKVTSLDAESLLLKLDGINSYNEACPIGGVWVPCGKNEPPGFGSAG